jgi:hypothetical protein
MINTAKRFHSIFTLFLPVVIAAAFLVSGCDRNGSPIVSTSKITATNYDKIHLGMTKAQVETILGPPSSADKKDILIYKKTTYRYEEGDKFIQLTFKNDELDSKDSNLAATH